MTYYLIVICFLFLCMGIDRYHKNGLDKSGDGLLYVAFLLLILLRTFIDIPYLPDLEYYKRVFDECRFLNYDELLFESQVKSIEVGYLFLSKICYTLSSSFYFELFVIGITAVTLYCRTIIKYSPFFWLGILIYFITIYPMSTYILRQYLAMAVLFGTIPLIIDRKLIPFAIAMVIAFLIHQSSIIWLPVYFIYGVNNKKVLIALLIAFAMALLVVDNLFSQALGVLGDDFERYQGYLDGDKVTTSYWGAILNTVFLLVFIFVFKMGVYDEGINRLVFIGSIITVVLSWVSVNSVGLMFRLSVYFSQFTILLLPIIVYGVKGKALRTIMGLMFIIVNFLPNYLVKRAFHEHKMIFSDNLLLVIVVIVVSSIVFVLFIKPKARKPLPGNIAAH